MSIPYIAVPNRRCVECGGLSVLEATKWLGTTGADSRLSEHMPFKCEQCGHEETVDSREAISSSGHVDTGDTDGPA